MNKVILLILVSLVVIIQAKDTNMIIYSDNEKHNMKVNLANFGFFKYGHKLTGRLQIGANFTYWGEEVDEYRYDKSNKNQQKEINFDAYHNETGGCKHYQQFNEKYIGKYGQPVYVVDRGNCTFVKKASNAAKYGKMLIIIDNSDEEDVEKITMGDDLSGEKVMIPVVMVSKKDGEIIKNFLNKELKERNYDESKEVWMTITFNKPHEGSKSEIQYWMIPSQKESYSFLSNHTVFIQTLISQEKATFEPHFVFFRCEDKCKKSYDEKQDRLENFCIQQGKYCHPDPDDKGPLTGVDSIKQAVIEICIQEIFPKYFLTYLFGFHDCFIVNNDKFLKCKNNAQAFVEQVHPSSKKESFGSKIDECVDREMFGRKGSFLLEKEYNLFANQGLKFFPALFVNGDLYRGDLLMKEGAEEFICEGFEDTDDIPLCDPYRDIKDDLDKFSDKQFISSEDSHTIIIVCVLLLVAFLVGLFIYRRKIKLEVQKELTVQVDAAIQQYYALNESK